MHIIPLLAACLLATPITAQQASVAGTDGTNALGKIPCSPTAAGALAECSAELIRKGAGNATLRVFLPGGATRVVYFEGGTATATSTTEKVRGKRAGDTYLIFVGEGERYQIPAAALQ